MPNPRLMKPEAATHPEMCIESMPRRQYVVRFHDTLLAVRLIPGEGGKGAVLDGWTDPIAEHDKKVLELEEAMIKEKDLVSTLRFYQRAEKNWGMAIGQLNENPHRLEEYLALKHEMRTYDVQVAQATTLEEKVEIQARMEKLRGMEPAFEKILAAKEQRQAVTGRREEAQQAVLAHGKDMARLRREEKEVADRITDDHVHACDRNKSLGEIFPSIQTGYILTRLIGHPDQPLEDMPFDEVLEELQVVPGPHTVEFMRYDKRFNRLTLEWETLEELRRQGKYVRDAREEPRYFVQACGQGDLEDLGVRLDRGEDIESRDLQGNTGMHVAAALSGIRVMSFLVEKKAEKEARNKNMETPLMIAAKRGAVDAVRWLLSAGAKLDVLDRARRTPLMCAILAKQEEVCSVLMGYSVSLRAVDIHWGWTPLHFAANVGIVTVATNLLKERASPYAKSKVNQTPLDVARGARQEAMISLLEAFLKAEPAHEVIEEHGVHIWQGSHEAAHPIWAGCQGFQCVLTLADPRLPDRKLSWLDDEEGLDHLRVEVEMDGDDSSPLQWERLISHARCMMNFLYKAARRKKKILVHCPRGESTSVAALVVYRLLKHGVAVQHTLDAVLKRRGDAMNLSPAVAAGLQRLQEAFSREREKRLVERARMAPILSLGF